MAHTIPYKINVTAAKETPRSRELGEKCNIELPCCRGADEYLCDENLTPAEVDELIKALVPFASYAWGSSGPKRGE